MDEKRKAVRRWLKDCSRSEFEAAVYEAKLTPFDEQVLRLHVLNGKTRLEIGEALGCSEDTAKKSLCKSYTKILPPSNTHLIPAHKNQVCDNQYTKRKDVGKCLCSTIRTPC